MSDKLDKKYIGVLISLAGLVCSSVGILINSIGVFYTPVSEGLGVLRGTFILHYTLGTLALSVTAFFAPKKLNKSNFKPLLTAAILTVTITTVLMGFSTKMIHFYILGLIRSAASAFYGFVVVTTVLNHWFIKNSSIITSSVMAFSGVGGAICSPLLNSVITNYGWRNAYFVAAALNLILCTPAIITKFSIHPQDCGYKPYGEAAHTNGTSTNEVSLPFSYRSVVFALCVCMSLLIGPAVFVSQQLASYTQFLGMGSALGAMMISCVMVGNISSKFIIGFLSQKIGSMKAVVTFVSLTIVALYFMMVTRTPWVMLVCAVFYGFEYCVSSVGVVLTVKDIYGKENYSKGYSSISMISSFGSILISTLCGYVYDWTHSYAPLFVIAIVAQVCTIGIQLYLHRAKARYLSELKQ